MQKLQTCYLVHVYLLVIIVSTIRLMIDYLGLLGRVYSGLYAL